MLDWLSDYWLFTLPLFGCSMLILVLMRSAYRKHRQRYHTRHCTDCEIPMTMRSQADIPEYLSSGQHTEQTLGSAEYDVWSCTGCMQNLVQRYSQWPSGYELCPTCKFITLDRSITVLKHATRRQEGRKQVDYRCQHCDYQHSKQTTILPKTVTESEPAYDRHLITPIDDFLQNDCDDRDCSDHDD